MLTFKQTVANPEGTAAVHVFIDEEKGHTVYLTQSGQLFVTEEKELGQKTRAAGFSMDSSSGCNGCDGC